MALCCYQCAKRSVERTLFDVDRELVTSRAQQMMVTCETATKRRWNVFINPANQMAVNRGSCHVMCSVHKYYNSHVGSRTVDDAFTKAGHSELHGQLTL